MGYTPGAVGSGTLFTVDLKAKTNPPEQPEPM